MSDTDIELLTMSKKIKQEANEILKIFNISEILKNFKLEIIGSYKLDLMYDRDLDIVVKSANIEKDSYDVLKKFIESKKFTKIQYGDFVNFPRNNRPFGYIINLFLKYEENIWETEIWFLEDISLSIEDSNKVNEKLNSENRMIILKEKEKRNKLNITKNELSSYKIYEKVLSL